MTQISQDINYPKALFPKSFNTTMIEDMEKENKTKIEKIEEEVFNILSSNYEQTLDDNGEADYTFDDEDRENIVTEMTAYILKLLK